MDPHAGENATHKEGGKQHKGGKHGSQTEAAPGVPPTLAAERPTTPPQNPGQIKTLIKEGLVEANAGLPKKVVEELKPLLKQQMTVELSDEQIARLFADPKFLHLIDENIEEHVKVGLDAVFTEETIGNFALIIANHIKETTMPPETATTAAPEFTFKGNPWAPRTLENLDSLKNWDNAASGPAFVSRELQNSVGELEEAAKDSWGVPIVSRPRQTITTAAVSVALTLLGSWAAGKVFGTSATDAREQANGLDRDGGVYRVSDAA